MSRGKHAVHLFGVLSLMGWVILAVGSRQEHPLNLFLAVMAWEWIIFLIARRVISRREPAPVSAVFMWGFAFLLCGFFAEPVMEDDHNRFLWDGYQFAITGNPYGAAPAARFNDPQVPGQFEEILDRINYPHVATIYGPVSEILFLTSYWIAPGRLWSWKLMVIGAQLVLFWTLLAIRNEQSDNAAVASSKSRSLQAALVVGWCPLLVFEIGFNAHPDIVGITLLMIGLWSGLRRWEILCGIFCGAAVGSKIFALLIAPFILRGSRRGWLAFAGTIIGLYAPFWLQRSGADWAGLSAFGRDWEFNSSLYGLAQSILGASIAKTLCALLFGVAWLVLLWRWFTRQPSCGASNAMPPGAAVFGLFLLCAATVNPWYALWLAPFVALRPTAIGLAATAFVSLSYMTGLNLGRTDPGNFEHPIWVRIVEYGGIAAVAVTEWQRRRGPKQIVLPLPC